MSGLFIGALIYWTFRLILPIENNFKHFGIILNVILSVGFFIHGYLDHDHSQSYLLSKLGISPFGCGLNAGSVAGIIIQRYFVG